MSAQIMKITFSNTHVLTVRQNQPRVTPNKSIIAVFIWLKPEFICVVLIN